MQLEQVRAVAEETFDHDLCGFAASDAAHTLVENWEAAMFDDPTPPHPLLMTKG